MQTEHFNKLTESQLERLSILAGECGSTMQAVSEVLRHGYSLPSIKHLKGTNVEVLERALGQLLAAASELALRNDISWTNVTSHCTKSDGIAEKITHHQN